MKILMLLLLISCGKHEEPVFVDMKDKDGDQILNHEEDSLNKYIADIDEIKKISGTLSFNQKEFHQFPLTNEFSLKEKILHEMTIDERLIKEDHFLHEWEKIKIKKDIHIPLTKLQYQIELKLDTDSGDADQLILKTDEGEMILGTWSNIMSFPLTKDELDGVLTGKFYFLIRKNLSFEKIKSIREKTFKFYFISKKRLEIRYVSKELDFEKLKHLLNIYQTFPYVEEDLLFNNQLPESPHLFHKVLKNGDHFLVEISPLELGERLKKHFTIKKHAVERINGTSSRSIEFKNPQGLKVYLRIMSFEQVLRTFGESSEKLTHRFSGGGGAFGNGPDRTTCTHYLRSIQTESKIIPSIDYLLKSINEIELIEKMTVIERFNQDRLETVLSFTDSPENMSFSLNNLKDNSYVTTGEYKNSCAHLTSQERKSAFKTNPEGKLSIEIESFVEKVL
jgi:hypothetical protein